MISSVGCVATGGVAVGGDHQLPAFEQEKD